MTKQVMLTLLFLLPPLCIAQWSMDPAVNTSLCTAAYNQTNVKMVRYDGGALVFWADLRDCNGEIPGDYVDNNHDGVTDEGTGWELYGQKLRSDGTVEWTAQGVSLFASGGGRASALSYDCTADGSGGACIVYATATDYNNYQLYATRVDASGSVVWSKTICNVSCSQDARIVKTDSGHVMIVWMISGSIRLQRVGIDGTIDWAANGIEVCNTTGSRSNPRIVEEGRGGAVFAWVDTRNGNDDVFAQRVDSSGAIKWTTNGIAVCTATNSQSPCELAYASADSSFYVVWSDYRGSNCDIYGQRLSLNGGIQWTSNGIGICTATGDQTGVQITVGRNGTTAYTTWKDARGTDGDIYAQRLEASGTVWSANGIVICNAAGEQSDPVIAPTSETDGAIICWDDNRGSDRDIYGQKVGSDGTLSRTANGEVLSNASGNQTVPAVVSDGADGAIVVWTDTRNSTMDVYTQRMLANFILPVELVSFSASLFDQTITLRWSTATEVDNFGFEIERQNGNNLMWIAAGFVKGCGTSNARKEYMFRDRVGSGNVVRYRLKQIDRNGSVAYSGTLSVNLGPSGFGLSRNFPNPCNPSTTISYTIPTRSHVRLSVFNTLGQKVVELVHGEKEAGSYNVTFDASRLASGVYFYRLQAGSFVQTKKLVVVK